MASAVEDVGTVNKIEVGAPPIKVRWFQWRVAPLRLHGMHQMPSQGYFGGKGHQRTHQDPKEEDLAHIKLHFYAHSDDDTSEKKKLILFLLIPFLPPK
jgi:hypothetical protein